MNALRRRPPGARAAELALAAPQVVAHRVARMAAAGPWPGQRDRREMHRMGAEKVAAFGESWLAMGLQAWRAQAALTMALATWWLPGGPATRQAGTWTAAAPWAHGWQRFGQDIGQVLEHGLDPVHRRAVANAKRLARRR